jgi:AraC-type DNA-binding domain-containing proteins
MSSICQCNQLLGAKTLHPLATVVDLPAAGYHHGLTPDSHSLMLITPGATTQGYGHLGCDFTAATLVARPPGRELSLVDGHGEPVSGRLLLFHRDLLSGTALGRRIGQYGFFGYADHEALHLSAGELEVVCHVLDGIDGELRRGVDTYSATILATAIELLLNYCSRYHHRQYIVRHDAGADPFAQLCQSIDSYMLQGMIRRYGMPCACHFAAGIGHSEDYLTDLVGHATGKSFATYVQLRRVELAKQMIVTQGFSDAKVSLTLGYGRVDNFRQTFLRLVGTTTEAYRN